MTPHKPAGFLAHLSAYAASEFAGKASRLLVVVVVARTLPLEAIGLAAAALAAGDILKAFTENGVGQRIISATDAELDARCNTARRIARIWCGALFVLQLIVALAIWIYSGSEIALLIALLAGEYLFMPAGLVQAALAMREGKLRQTAAIAGGQVAGANLITVVLALVWPSALALVLPRLLMAPVWLILMRRLRPWDPVVSAGQAPLSDFSRYGLSVLGIEFVKVLRLQADKLLVGALLGAEALGVYFMAFNAGLGLSTSFAQAFSIAFFPHICSAKDKSQALRKSLGQTLMMISPVIVLQSALAPFYVPLLLGPDWSTIAPTVAVLCLAAFPTLVWSAVAGWLRATGRPQQELAVSAILAGLLMLNTVVMAPYGILSIAWGYLAVSTITLLAATAYLHPPKAIRLARKV